MLRERFEALITWDQNLEFQQNFSKYPITVFVFNTPVNDYAYLKPLIPKIADAIKQGTKSGPYVIK